MAFLLEAELSGVYPLPRPLREMQTPAPQKLWIYIKIPPPRPVPALQTHYFLIMASGWNLYNFLSSMEGGEAHFMLRE